MAKRSNNKAIEDYQSGKSKKKFSETDLIEIKPKTRAQEEVFHLYNEDKSMVLSGSAGTGKTFLSTWLGLREVLSPSVYNKLIFVRSATPTKEIGYLPGELELKQSVYEAPYKSICSELFPYANAYDNLKAGGYIDFMLTSFIRGVTIRDSIVILDEAASCTLHEIDTVITRLGENSKIIICGDIRQSDLSDRKCGMGGLLQIAERAGIETVNFMPQDIVRGGLVKDWIIAREELGI